MYKLNGDLDQMYEQMEFLKFRGFNVDMKDNIPSISESDYPQAIKLIYFYYIGGWWNYKDELILLKICTIEQFEERLGLKYEQT